MFVLRRAMASLALVVLSFALVSCLPEFFTQERGINVSSVGGSIGCESTLTTSNISVASGLPYVLNLTIENSGQIPIGFWGIYDISDQDSPSWHGGRVTVDYADKTSSFALDPGETYPFTLTLDNLAVASTAYEIEVGIPNKNDVTPNPFTFRVRFVTVP
jgi:hypothetical protein